MPELSIQYNHASSSGELYDKISECESNCAKASNWDVKIQEKSGMPLINALSTNFPIISGCPRSDFCKVCENGSGGGCSGKNLVYEAECDVCVNDNHCPIDLSGRGGNPMKLSHLCLQYILPSLSKLFEI